MKSPIAANSPTTLPKSCQLSWHIETDFRCLEDVRDEWNSLLEQLSGFGFSSYEYCQVWWNHYSDSRRLRVFIFRIDSELVGIVPLLMEQVSLGPVSIKVAKLLASDHVFSICSPPITPEHTKQIVSVVAKEIIDRCNCDLLCFSPLCEVDDLSRTKISEIGNASSTGHILENRVLKVQTFFRIPDSFNDYLKSLSKNGKRNCQRYWTQLCEKYHIEEETCKDCNSVKGGFEEFWRMHTAQWERQGKLGHFGDWPGSLEFHRELVASQAEMGNCRLYRIIADGQVISSRYGFRFGEHMHTLLSARLIGEQWDRLGIGRIGVVRMIKAAIEEGIRTLEEGPTHYPYKLSLGAMECNSRSLLITSSRSSARWRVNIFKYMAAALDKLYYRIYFSRIAPLLPWKPKPLWRLWIRSRL